MKLFIDCGTNLGQGLNFFNKKYKLFNNPEWQIYTFEPNPHCNLDSMFNNVNNLIKITKAVWINNDDEMEFICKGKKSKQMRLQYNEDRFQGGGSQLKKTFINSEIPEHVEIKLIKIKTIDFGKFLLDMKNSNLYEYIIVKMDIEGAEFQIIEKLEQDDTLKLIDELYVEPHGRFEFKKSEWNNKKKEIGKTEQQLISTCKKHIKNVVQWS